jgi:Do/DeqQ family serine protease
MVNRKGALLGSAVTVLVFALGGACSSDEQLATYAAVRGGDPRGASKPPVASRPAVAVGAQAPEARQVSQAFVAVAERLAPSVVRITIRQRSAVTTNSPSAEGAPFEGTPFERFFEEFGPMRPQPSTGMGSGVVIDERGHILTNNHVVARADDVRVTFVDGKELEAKVIGTDPKTDLAVVKVDGADVTPAEFGDADGMRVGEWVMAIGNPFGLDHSVTVGVLSAKGRHGFAPGKLEDFLQTDASINPGNSGGPLVDLGGKVVGINTMIAGLGTGVGFAVSESIARPVANALIQHGKVTRPYIGVAMQTLTPELAQALGGGAPEKGALVSQVESGSPAAKAGIQVGDVVVRIAGEPTADSREVQEAVLEQKVGEEVAVTVWRDGKQVDLRVRTAELPAAEAATSGERRDRAGRLGLRLQTLTPDLAARLGLDRGVGGAVVTGVRPGSAAAEAGLRQRDVIVSVDRRPVTSVAQAVRQLGQRRAAGHLLRVRRGDQTFFTVVPGAGEDGGSPD